MARETRKIYQDHYFLCDPDKFIFEFFPMAAENQLLEHPISMTEFENLPLIRSTFFHFGLGLARSEGTIQAVLKANERGEANVYLNAPTDVSFHYSLTKAHNGGTSVKAAGGKFPLGRFVLMSTQLSDWTSNTEDEETTFALHLPSRGSYLLDISAARYPTADACLAKEPIYYINVCKFRIDCRYNK